MKTFISSLVLFLVVTIFVTANTVFLRNIFDEISDLMKTLPKTLEQTNYLSEKDLKKHEETLKKIEKLWKKHEEYIYITLEHSAAGRFTEYFLPAKEYFLSRDFPSYLASLETAKDILEQFETNEGVSFENIF